MLTLGRASAAAMYATMSSDEIDAGYDNGIACRPMLADWKARWFPLSATERAAAAPECLDLRYGTGKDERIDFFPASTGDPATAPTLLYIHGGYWHMNNPKENNAWIGTALRKVGVNVAVIEYGGLPNPEPSPIGVQCGQVLAATEFLADELRAKRLPGDPNRLVVSGHSAGGQLSSVCALHPPCTRCTHCSGSPSVAAATCAAR